MMKVKSGQVHAPNVVRVFYDFEDFKLRVDDSSPVHYEVELKRLDSQGTNWVLVFHLYGIDRKRRLMMYEFKWTHGLLQVSQRQKIIDELVSKVARPMNALPGRIEIRASQRRG